MNATTTTAAAPAQPAAPTGIDAFRVLVATLAYGGMVHLDYVRSLFSFAGAGIAFEWAAIGNESLITRARNTLLAQFHARPEFTHLLFLDADVFLDGAGLRQLLAIDMPVVAAPVALKGRRPDGSRLWNLGRCTGTVGGLVKVQHVGTAALLLARDAVQALIEDAEADGRVYARAGNHAGTEHLDLQYDVFQVGVRDGQYLSEDYWVCQRLVALGFDVLVDPSVVTRHHGTVAT
jgi:hypothetical protein